MKGEWTNFFMYSKKEEEEEEEIRIFRDTRDAQAPSTEKLSCEDAVNRHPLYQEGSTGGIQPLTLSS